MDSKIVPYDLKFKFHAGTSRGWLRTKKSYFIKIQDNHQISYGECSLIPELSPDNINQIENWLHEPKIVLEHYNSNTLIKISPAMNFAVEMAKEALETQSELIHYKNEFSKGNEGIPINGLIWMSDIEIMLNSLRVKVNQGFRCIKIKVGAIEFSKELELLRLIREQFDEKLILRLDANGAFHPDEAESKLEQLAQYDIHSIEQPIAANQWAEMHSLCRKNIIPIALDEELIGHYSDESRKEMIEAIRPQYIILKPSLLGGLKASSEWIRLAESLGIDYWVTSALESNIGLNAIAQWSAKNEIKGYQGLGTGGLFENNIESPLRIKGEKLYHSNGSWDLDMLTKLFSS